MTKSWKKLRSSIIFKNSWLLLQKDTVVKPDGKEGEYTMLVARPFVVIVALTPENRILMIKQYRYPVDRLVIEFPAGGIENNNRLEDARRELKEETGYVSDEWTEVGDIHELVSISQQLGYIFLAHNCLKTEQPKRQEEIIEEVLSVAPVKIQNMIAEGVINDALTIAVFHRVQHLL